MHRQRSSRIIALTAGVQQKKSCRRLNFDENSILQERPQDHESQILPHKSHIEDKVLSTNLEDNAVSTQIGNTKGVFSRIENLDVTHAGPVITPIPETPKTVEDICAPGNLVQGFRVKPNSMLASIVTVSNTTKHVLVGNNDQLAGSGKKSSRPIIISDITISNNSNVVPPIPSTSATTPLDEYLIFQTDEETIDVVQNSAVRCESPFSNQVGECHGSTYDKDYTVLETALPVTRSNRVKSCDTTLASTDLSFTGASVEVNHGFFSSKDATFESVSARIESPSVLLDISEALPNDSPADLSVKKTSNSTSDTNKSRKCKTNPKYLDYASDTEDFSTFYGDIINDSDEWKDRSSTDVDTDELNTANKKKNFRRRPTRPQKGNDSDVETVGELATKVKKINKRKERATQRRVGKEYTNKKGEIVPEKKVLPNPCQGKKCGHDCGSLTEERRAGIFKHFWGLDASRRRDWLISLSQKVGVKRKRSDSDKRTCSINYFINEGEGKRPVCLQFISATINVPSKTIYKTVKASHWGCAKEDMRGKTEPANKTKETTIEAVVTFIKKLPAVPSHYCRQDSSKVYLPEEFKNIGNIYNIYKNVYINQGTDVVSERVFRNIFEQKFNIGFHVPKKDKCKKCLQFSKTTDPKKLKEKEQHEKEKEESYARFKTHKNIHKDDPAILCASFDLEKVLNTPYSPSMLLYYSRKLSVLNFCVYESGTRKAFCYYWDESNGKRGANEIATIMHKYIKLVDARGNVQTLLLYCDCCPGQNRNRTMLAMVHQTLQQCQNIQTIQLNYLLTGHTYMPVDTMHAMIECNLKQTTVYAPSQWFTIFQTARKNPSPFEVERMTYEDFQKWDNVGDKFYKGNLTGKISKVRIATFKKERNYVTIKTSMNTKAQSYNVEVQSKTSVPLMACYRSLLPISKEKYKDLKQLCTDHIIPNLFQNEFLNLPREASVKDVLPDTDIEDPDYDE